MEHPGKTITGLNQLPYLVLKPQRWTKPSDPGWMIASRMQGAQSYIKTKMSAT